MRELDRIKPSHYFNLSDSEKGTGAAGIVQFVDLEKRLEVLRN